MAINNRLNIKIWTYTPGLLQNPHVIGSFYYWFHSGILQSKIIVLEGLFLHNRNNTVHFSVRSHITNHTLYSQTHVAVCIYSMYSTVYYFNDCT